VVSQPEGFKKLLAWQRAHELASFAFALSREVAKSDRWLASQVSRAAISVPANIAEGYGRGSQGDYLRFLDIARGSLSELEYYLLFLGDLALIDAASLTKASALQQETGRLLNGLWKSLKAKQTSTWDHSGGTGQIREEYAIYEVDV
jgi:four helix bundle protein